MANNRPAAPEVGEFQVVEWDSQKDQWWIRDKTEAELYRETPLFDSWVWSEQESDWMPPTPKPDPNAQWDEDSQSWTPGPEILAAQVPDIRKEKEAEGVTVNGIRYAGNPANRQALSEALQFAAQAGVTTFPRWKDSDGQYWMNHLVSDVQQALEAIGARRSALIGLEADHVESVLAGTVTDLRSLNWTV